MPTLLDLIAQTLLDPGLTEPRRVVFRDENGNIVTSTADDPRYAAALERAIITGEEIGGALSAPRGVPPNLTPELLGVAASIGGGISSPSPGVFRAVTDPQALGGTAGGPVTLAQLEEPLRGRPGDLGDTGTAGATAAAPSGPRFRTDDIVKGGKILTVRQAIDENGIPTGGQEIVGQRDLDPLSAALERQLAQAQLATAEARLAQLQAGGGGGGAQGGVKFQSEIELENAQAEVARATAKRINAEMTGLTPSGQPTFAAMEANRQYNLAVDNYNLAKKRAEDDARLRGDELAMKERIAEMDAEIRRHDIDVRLQLGQDENRIRQGQLDLDRELGLGGLEIKRSELDLARQRAATEERLGERRLGLEEQLGLGQLAQGERRLGLEERLGLGQLGLRERELEQQVQESALDRAVRQAQVALEREIGLGQLALQRGQALGEIEGRPTLERELGVANLLGELQGRATLGGRAQTLQEQEAAFRRLSTPSASGATLGLIAKGLLPASAFTTGDVSGLPLSAQPAQSGGFGETSFSLQQLKGLKSRELDALGGFLGTQGVALQDVVERGQSDLSALGEGVPRRRRVLLGAAA